MSVHLNTDAVALLALVVSLVALFIALLQVIQQYAATAYDYRRCSPRTMGGWATKTERKFVPSEIRFEITYSVPHIELLNNCMSFPLYTKEFGREFQILIQKNDKTGFLQTATR